MSPISKPIMTRYPVIRLSLRDGDVDSGVQDLSRVLTVVGSGAGSDLPLSSDRVDPVHAAVIRLGDTAYVCDLGGAGGTRVNQRFVRWERLQDGDELAFGPFIFEVEMETAGGTIVASTRPFSLRNEQAIGVICSEDPVLLIGSDATCDIVLSGSDIAPRHALVAWTFDGPILRDLTGDASTRVNGRRVRESTLKHGDSVGVGACELVFEVASSGAGAYDTGSSQASPQVMQSSAGPGRMIAGRVPAAAPAEIPLKPLGDDSYADAIDAAVAYEHLSEEEASLELVRAMDEIAGSTEVGQAIPFSDDSGDDVQPLDDSDVLELLEDVEEIHEAVGPTEEWSRAYTDRSKEQETVVAKNSTRQRGPEFADEFEPHRIATSVDAAPAQCSPDLRARVIAAQNALDERARKLREELDAERSRLRACQDQLQEQARRLLQAAKVAGQPAADAGNGSPAVSEEASQPKPDHQPVHEPHAASGNGNGATRKADMKTLEKLFSGSVDLDAPARRNNGETQRAAASASNGKPRGNADSLQDQVSELAMLVRGERDEMQASEGRLESLKFEIERLRADIIRSREKHQVQQAEHEARYQTLQRSIAAVKHEREALLVRLRRLDTKESALKTRMEEADRVRKDLEHEAERLARTEELHDDRLRELRVSLESERHRLRLRQTEMQKKASELAKLARTRRKAIEQIVNQHQESLKEQESELMAKRTALAEAGRAELEKTATELEQLLSVRLADVESELLTRQESLDTWIHAIYDVARPITASGKSVADKGATTPRAAVDARASLGSLSDPKIPAEGRHLAQLETELEGLHRAVLRLEDDGDRRTAPLTQTSAYSSFSDEPPSWSRPTRWGSGLTSRLSEKISSLRSGIEDIARSVGSARLSQETIEVTGKLPSGVDGTD